MGVSKKLLFGFTVIFLIGWLASAVHSDFSDTTDSPTTITRTIPPLAAPGDHITEDQILVYKDKVVLDVEDVRWARFTPTGSMKPLISDKANTIERIPENPESLNVGDVISYRSEFAEGLIIHRIIEIGQDQNGWYCIVKGDSLDKEDPGKIRFNQITGVVIAVIY